MAAAIINDGDRLRRIARALISAQIILRLLEAQGACTRPT